MKSRNKKGSLHLWVSFFFILIIVIFFGMVNLEFFVRWLSVRRAQSTIQATTLNYALQLTKFYSEQNYLQNYFPNCQEKICTPSSFGKSREFVKSTQFLLFALAKNKPKSPNQITNISNYQCYTSHKNSRFAKNPKSPINECNSTGQIVAPFMSLNWNFEVSPYGYGVCCPTGSSAGKIFCVEASLNGRLDPIMAGGLPFLFDNDYIKNAVLKSKARAVVSDGSFAVPKGQAIKHGNKVIFLEDFSTKTCPPNPPPKELPQVNTVVNAPKKIQFTDRRSNKQEEQDEMMSFAEIAKLLKSQGFSLNGF